MIRRCGINDKWKQILLELHISVARAHLVHLGRQLPAVGRRTGKVAAGGLDLGVQRLRVQAVALEEFNWVCRGIGAMRNERRQ